MRKRKRALVDVDGVCIDFLAGAFEVINEIAAPLVYDMTQLPSWDIFDWVPREYEDAFYEKTNVRGFCSKLPVYPGTVEGLRELEEVADVYIVTSPLQHSETWMFERDKAIVEQLGIPSRRIIHTSAKYVCIGDLLVDDKPANVTKWKEHHPEGHGLLWDQFYNRSETGLRRVTNWSEVVDLVRTLS